MAGETLLGGDAPVETVADPAVVAPATAEAAPAETKPTDKPVGAPEKYEDFKAPEGIELDKTQVEAFVPLAKELGLTQEAAQKLVDFYASNQAAAARAQETAWNATVDGWIAAAKSDKEIGGAALGENLAVAKKALDMFGTPALKEALNATGTGSHPELIRFMVKVGKAISDDKFIPPGGVSPGTQPKSAAEILFPNMPQ